MEIVEAEIVVDISIAATGTPKVMVKEHVWYGLDYRDKTRLIEAMNCWAFGPGNSLGYTEIVSNMTNRVMGRWEQGTGLIVVER